MLATLMCFLVLWALKIYDVPTISDYTYLKQALIALGAGFTLSLIARLIIRKSSFLVTNVELYYLKKNSDGEYITASEDETGVSVHFDGDGCGSKLIFFSDTSLSDGDVVIIENDDPYVEIESTKYKSEYMRILFFNLRMNNVRLFIRQQEMEIIKNPEQCFAPSADGMHMD